MGPGTLLFSASFALVIALVYAVVGHQVQRRAVSSEAWTAQQLFAVWWYALAASSGISGVMGLAGWAGVATLPLFTTLTQLSMLTVAVALGALLYYLLYLLNGSAPLLIPLSLFSLAYYALGLTYLSTAEPSGIHISGWDASLAFADGVEGPLAISMLLLVVVPRVLGVLALFTLYFSLDTRDQRVRLALVCWGLLVWIQSGVLATAPGMDSDWLQLTTRAVGVSATLGILAAYEEPDPVLETAKHRA